jgi:hypothetical protein
MDSDPGTFRTMMKLPSAFLAVAMSLAALTMVLGTVAASLTQVATSPAIRIKESGPSSSSLHFRPEQIERPRWDILVPVPVRRPTNTLVWIDTFVQWIRRRASASLALDSHPL